MDGPIYIPSGGPGEGYPSADKPPDAVIYMRLYAGLLAVASIASVLGIIGTVVLSATGASLHSSGPTPLFGEIAALVFYGGGGTVVAVPAGILLFAPRKPWAHTLGLVMVALGMVTMCCLPVTIPLLLAWTKPEVKLWYSA